MVRHLTDSNRPISINKRLSNGWATAAFGHQRHAFARLPAMAGPSPGAVAVAHQALPDLGSSNWPVVLSNLYFPQYLVRAMIMVIWLDLVD